MSPVTAVLFDLDGTLVDSLADITASTNVCLAAMGRATYDSDAVRGFVGHGIGTLVRRALGDTATDADEAALLASIRSHYTEHCTDRTTPFQGIESLLSTLVGRGVHLGVVSNKPHDMTTRIATTLFPQIEFGFVTGERSEVPRKPDPTGILIACSTLDVTPESVLYVGDTPVDMDAARAAGVRSVAVTWGFRDANTLADARPDHMVDRPEDILRLVGR